MNHLDGLNQAQKQAALHKDGPLLVIAGAGAGKTRTVVHRILELIHSGVAPEQILAVTFTNKAAKEMRERVQTLLANDADLHRSIHSNDVPFVSTFHALGVHILRTHAQTFGVPKHFTIFDRSDSLRAIKTAMKERGYDPQAIEPRKILGTISKAKGNGQLLDTYQIENEGEYYPELVGEVWGRYEEILSGEKAFDFDDLLLQTVVLLEKHPNVLKNYQDQWRYVHIDEYQDTNVIQNKLAGLLVGVDHNICVVGDVDQCLVKGTKVTTADGKKKNIENIRVGDLVLSNYGSGDYRPAEVLKTFSRSYHGQLISITTESGKKLISTQEHIHFAGYRLGLSPQYYFTYLMYKRGYGYRLGTSQVYTKGQRKPMIGFQQRCNHEHADMLWIVGVHDSASEARVLECQFSLHYGIPTLPFVARKGRSKNGYVHDQTIIDRVVASLNTDASAKKLLHDKGLSILYPHHRAQTAKDRINIVVTLCGDRRGKTPMHRLSIVSKNDTYRKKLKKEGFSIRKAKAHLKSWRFETAYKDYEQLLNLVKHIQQVLPEVVVVKHARLGKSSQGRRERNALPYLPASAVLPGMSMFTSDGTYEIVKSVSRSHIKKGRVFDLCVANTHNFIANGITTHNSIYSWRGANVENLLKFEKHFPNAKVIHLEENYRSTKTIIAASNQVIEKNVNRPEKNLFTKNSDGEKMTLYGAYDEADEAQFVTNTIAFLRVEGVPLQEIAVLYRANFQSRIIEEFLLQQTIPYQILGTRFFERKEVKDILSFLRLALNPQSVSDLTRVVNVPPRGIGKITLLRMVEGREHACTPKVQEKIAAFRNVLAEIESTIHTKKASEVIRFVARRSGLEEHLAHGTDDDAERLENIKELASLARKYDNHTGDDGITALLTDAALATDQDELGRDVPGVKLMTVHAAKGLEFDYVFIVGLEDGLFPHEDMGEGERDEEEERRLFYVALTRARKKVFLLFAASRMIYGAREINTPSEFITDIDEALLAPVGTMPSKERTIYLDEV